MFPLRNVPSNLMCPHCHQFIRPLDLAARFEWYTARLLGGELAEERQQGFDVQNSQLIPDVTFQVKCAKARKGQIVAREIDGRECVFDESPHWTWQEHRTGRADIYFLYGIIQGKVFPFIVDRFIWLDEAYDNGRGGKSLRISTDQYSKCGRYMASRKLNKFWQYYVRSWPQGLFDVCKYYAQRVPLVQGDLI